MEIEGSHLPQPASHSHNVSANQQQLVVGQFHSAISTAQADRYRSASSANETLLLGKTSEVGQHSDVGLAGAEKSGRYHYQRDAGQTEENDFWLEKLDPDIHKALKYYNDNAKLDPRTEMQRFDLYA